MEPFIEVTVKHMKKMEDGTVKKVAELYLVKAYSFTEAETIISEEMERCGLTDFQVSAVKKSNLSEIHHDDTCERWYKVKISMMTFDDTSDKEKKTGCNILIQSNELKNALAKTFDVMRSTVSDYFIESIVETKIIDVID